MKNINPEYRIDNSLRKRKNYFISTGYSSAKKKQVIPSEILLLSSFPPRECGIATYSQDLIKSIQNKFSATFNLSICAIENENENHSYFPDVKYRLNTSDSNSYSRLSSDINSDDDIKIILIQHEFGFFENSKTNFLSLINSIKKPVIISFHTVLPFPGDKLREEVKEIVNASTSVIVMTKFSANVLINDYEIIPEKIKVIPHGTHLVKHPDKNLLKEKYNLSHKLVLSTFGLLSSGKNIETTLDALPAIINANPYVIFLIIGKTHPAVIKQEGEKYREMLEEKVKTLQLEDHVKFINAFLPLDILLEYLQLTDIYLFTSKDPNQAVSGTFAYAISCGCPVISTAIPHAKEVLGSDAGIIIDFENSSQLARAAISLLNDKIRRDDITAHGLHKMASTAWENSSIAHALLFSQTSDDPVQLQYTLPALNLDHLKKLTTGFGMVQFSKINKPDIKSGYTLDDNARAMIALCQHFELTLDKNDIPYIKIYLNFIKHCLQLKGSYLNYVNEAEKFTDQNQITNLEDSNGRAIWALGYLISINNLLPYETKEISEKLFEKSLSNLHKMHSTRAIAFAIKGLYYEGLKEKENKNILLIKMLADRLHKMYLHVADKEWPWFEDYLTYANSIIPEAMLCAYLVTNDTAYKNVAVSSFNFLLSKTFSDISIKVISNKTWLQKEEENSSTSYGGEQPIDVAYTILALSKFYDVFKNEEYLIKMKNAFDWFLGNNHLNQIIYNPVTGGCYDGLEENYVNLNQGAESTVSYLMARLTIEKYSHEKISGRKILHN